MNQSQFGGVEKSMQYISSMRPVFNKTALFSDASSEYVKPYRPKAYGTVTIRFRTAKNNVDKVYFVDKTQKHFMIKMESDELFDYYEHMTQLENETLHYYFEIHNGKVCCYYDVRGAVKDIQEYYAFRVVPGFETPEWASGAVMYQIYVDRFFNGDQTNDVLDHEYFYIGDYSSQVKDWNQYPNQMGVREFYGGDLQGVLDKLDYLQDLGVDVIYFNPLFVSPSNHKYDIQDYDFIDPHFGKIVLDEGELLTPDQKENRLASRYITRVTSKENLEASNSFFAKVVEEIHKKGMKVILDGVFNHCGSFNKWMDKERIYENAEGYEKGAYVSAESPYRDYFHFYNKENWPYNATYDGWWGHDTLPKLNYEESKELYDYILYIGKKWVSPPYNVDGWRLDVAADLGHGPEFNHQFWKDFRKAVKEANPNAIILAEHYGNPEEWLRGDEWDTVMNYDAFMEPLTWFLTGMQKHSDDYREDLFGNTENFWGAMRHHSASFTHPSISVAMNELSNHDHSRFLTRTNKKVGRTNTLGAEAANQGVKKEVLREAVLMQMTWIGAPTIYYGDEAGVCGFTDPDNRRTYPWGAEDKELIRFHKEMIRIHKKNPEFIHGSIKEIYSDYNVLSYGRFWKHHHSVVILNNNDSKVVLSLTVWQIGVPKDCVMQRLILTDKDGFSIEPRKYVISGGKLECELPPLSAVVMKYEGESAEENLSEAMAEMNEEEQRIKKEEERKKFLHFL